MDPASGVAVEWLAVAPAEALTPPAGFHPQVDEWLDIVNRERRAGVVPEVPILVGLTPGGAASTPRRGLDVRVIDFMNHPAGAAVCSPLTAQVLRYQLPVFLRWLAGRASGGMRPQRRISWRTRHSARGWTGWRGRRGTRITGLYRGSTAGR